MEKFKEQTPRCIPAGERAGQAYRIKSRKASKEKSARKRFVKHRQTNEMVVPGSTLKARNERPGVGERPQGPLRVPDKVNPKRNIIGIS